MTEIANRTQFDAWNGDSGRRWVDRADERDGVLAPVADALFAAARLVPGERVLDVGCGCGATTLAAAAAVGPSGDALGIDLSDPMLDVARRRAESSEAATAAFAQADAQTYDFGPEPFDVVISRFGTMFFSDPGAAFVNVVSALRPGGRLCIATWQPLVANEWLTVPGAALLGFGSLPTAECGPGMFAQSDPAVLESLLVDAGLVDIDVARISLTLTVGRDIDGAVAYLSDAGPGRAVLETVPDDQRAAALEAVRNALASHVAADGVRLDAAVLVTTARSR